MDGNPIYVAPFLGLGVALKAPTADGSANQVIKTDGSGNLSFVTITSGITIDSTAITSGAATQILFENASNQVSSSASFTIDSSLNVAIAAGTLAISGAGAAEIPFTVTGAAAQSVDLAQWNPNGVAAGESAHVNSAGEFSSGPSTNEFFGDRAGEHITSGVSNTFIGWNAGNNVAAASYSTMIGYQAGHNNSSNGNIFIGYGAGGGGGDAGTPALTSGAYNVSLGYGSGGTAGITSSIGLGCGAYLRESNQFVSGANGYPINNIYFGKGVVNATPTNYTIHGTGGSGTDIAGADITIAGGKGTGDAAGGDILFQTSDAGASGTTLQSLSTAMTIEGNTGNVGIGTPSPGTPLHVVSSTALTNTVSTVAKVSHITSGTPANGIGVAVEFEVETSADNNEIGATIEAVTTDTTSTSEDFELDFNIMLAGAAASQRLHLGAINHFVGSVGVKSAVGGSTYPQLIAESPGATNPSILPNSGDQNTGIGTSGSDQLSLIAGAVEGIRLDGYGNVTIAAGTLAISGAGAAEIPLSVELAAAQSANAFEINSNGGSGGDDLVVESGGYLGVNVDPSSIANPGTISVKNIANYAFNCDGNILHKSDGTNYAYMGKASTWSGSLSTDYMIASYRPKLHLAANGAGTPSMTFTATGTGIGVSSPAEMLQVDDAIAISSDAEGSTARLTRRTAHETHTLAAAGTSDTTTISIPSGARLLGVSFNVNTAVSDDGGDDTWSAAFVTGSTTTLATAAAAAQNTKVNLMLPDEISTGVCQIRFTANGGSFDAGVIEIVAYYEELTSLANV